MKKLIFLIALIFTSLGYSQAEFEKIAITDNTATAETSRIVSQQPVGGELNYINATALPVSTATTNALELETDVSAGAITGFALTNNGDGTVNIASGTAFLRTTNDPYAQIIKYPISAVTNLALTDNANNFVLVDYNGGSPTITVTTNASTINTQTNSLAYVIARVGNNLEYLNLVGQNVDPNAKLRIRFLNQEGIRRASGAVLGFSNRNLTLTSSVLFSGLIRINAAAFNTASPDTFTLAYNNGSVWTRTTGQTQVNNTQYNVSGTLTTMPNNTFRTDYVYLLPNNPSKLYVIMGNTIYGSLTLAKGAPRPSSLPVELQVLGLEVGRLFIEKNNAAIAEVQSSFANDFIGAAVPEHNSLTGLQGGTSGEYNHLTNAQAALVDGSEQTVNKQNSLTPDGTGVKFPTVDAVNGGITKSFSSNKKIVQTKKRAIFSFIWDDIQSSDLNVYNVFQEYGYVPNYALVTSSLNSGNKDLYIDFYNKGCSILAHSVTHPNMSGTTLTNAQVDAEMVNSKKAIEAYGIRVSGWVTPNSTLNSLYYPQIDKNFGYGFTNTSGAYNQTVDKLRLSRVSLEEAMYGHNLANVQAIIDDAIANNKLITFYAHSLPSTYLNVDTTPSLTETDLRAILAYLKTKSDDNLCEVLSTDEAVKNYYANSLISEDGLAVNINGFSRILGTLNTTYSPAFSSSSTGAISSVNNLYSNDGGSCLTNYSTNRASGVNASIYLGVTSTSTDHQSIFVVGRKIDASNWKESFRIGYSGNFMINSATDDGAKLSINDATGGNSLRINRGTGGVLFASDSNSDALAIYNKTGSTLYQKWNADGTSTFGGGIISTAPIRLKNYTVSTLPAGTQGDTAYVTDATAPTYLGTLTGGGSVVCPVFYNGTAWVSH